jgi:hypothetical protein
MLLDTAVGRDISQKCTISSQQGILIPIWSGECDQATAGHFNDSGKELANCARAYDLGRITGQVRVDDTTVAKLEAIDYNTLVSQNVTEIYTGEFDLPIPSDTHMAVEKFGTFPAVAHGWFVFLKPLSPGQHTVYYENFVRPTTLSGAENVNSARISYSFVVE